MLRPVSLRLPALFAFLVLGAQAQPLSSLRESFRTPPADARPMVRWWWFGPAVTRAGVDREMEAMRAAGIGGFEVQPVYPLALDDPEKGFRNLPFLSPEFLDVLGYTARQAKERGLRFDLTLGSGWPFGGPAIPVTQAAGRLRIVTSAKKPGQATIPVPDLGHGETLIAAFSGGVRQPDPHRVRANEANFFIASRTGMMVKRPSVNAEGFVLDHYDARALQTHLRSTGDPLLAAVRENKPKAIFCDSLEVFGSDWTGDLMEEFRRRRGYDLTSHLLKLRREDRSPDAAAVRHDWGRTLTELLEDRFLSPLAGYAEAQGVRLRIQNYGIPPATLSSNRYGESEGEGVDWKEVRAARWAASANHHFGRKVTTSETLTWLHSPSFRATPLDIKAEADIHFLQGVNQIIAHGWPYSAEEAAWPGWRFYAAGAFSDKNPWWMVMPDLSRYLQRVSWLLREGEAANSAALYLPNADAWSGFTTGRVHMIEALREHLGKRVMPEILDAGYGLDFIDDGTLDALPRYKALILPGVEYLPVGSAVAMERFARNGGVVLATRRLPERAPGLRATGGEHAQVATTMRSVAGSAVPEEALGAELRKRLQPEMELGARDPEIGFVHRKLPGADVYFVANTGNKPKQVSARFRHEEGSRGEWWDPLTGLPASAQPGAMQTFSLEPYGSRVLVFHREAAQPKLEPAWISRQVNLSKGWTVAFPGAAARAADLVSWTEREETLFFSGQAVYEREASLPAAVPERVELDFGAAAALPVQDRKNGMRAWLDPPVREAAEVFVNGQRAGALWCPPYRLDITPFARPGLNRLRIKVANTAMNHMAGQPMPDYRLLNLRYGVRFEPQDMEQVQPLPSGLIGGVQLILSEQERRTSAATSVSHSSPVR